MKEEKQKKLIVYRQTDGTKENLMQIEKEAKSLFDEFKKTNGEESKGYLIITQRLSRGSVRAKSL